MCHAWPKWREPALSKRSNKARGCGFDKDTTIAHIQQCEDMSFPIQLQSNISLTSLISKISIALTELVLHLFLLDNKSCTQLASSVVVSFIGYNQMTFLDTSATELVRHTISSSEPKKSDFSRGFSVKLRSALADSCQAPRAIAGADLVHYVDGWVRARQREKSQGVEKIRAKNQAPALAMASSTIATAAAPGSGTP